MTTPITPELIRTLAKHSMPTLHFAATEQYFPIRAEAWLTHTTSAPWEADPDDIGALEVDPHHRGTALLASTAAVSDHTRLGGPPNPADDPLRLAATSHADAIGNPAYAKEHVDGKDLFLSFAGWQDAQQPIHGGDLAYLRRAFSELASLLNRKVDWQPDASKPKQYGVPWEPLSPEENRPRFALPQPAAPATYCEVEWAGAHFRNAPPTDIPLEQQAFLDGFLQVTYYYLFPARTPLTGQEISSLEGQWAAISLFFPVEVDAQRLDETNRPLAMALTSHEPAWVALSGDPEFWSCGIHPFGGGTSSIETKDGMSSVEAWVGGGSHRMFANQNAEVPNPETEPAPSLNYEPGDDFELLWPTLWLALPTETWPKWLKWLTALGWGPHVAIWWFLSWIFNLLKDLFDGDDDPPKIPPSGEGPVPPGGTVGDPSFGEPVPAAVGEAGGTADFPTNDGSPGGHDMVFFDVRTISRLEAITGQHSDLAPPPWWSYAGRWGIKVPPEAVAAAGNPWISGSRRTDGAGRSWAYWMAYNLFQAHLDEAL